MAKIGILQKTIINILGFFVSFLMWFVRLVSFIGDVTIWITKAVLLSILRLFRGLRLDFKKKFPGFSKLVSATIHHPVINTDRSFKVGLLTIFVLMAAAWFVTKDLPSPKKLETREVPQTTKIFDRNGDLLFNVYTDENRTLVPLSDIPDNLKLATIAVEDQDFYKHKGFDVFGIIRAASKTVFEGDVQGGSTITQQLVKSAFLTPEQTINRKVKELYLAFRVEMAFSKDRILEMYLNQVPYGGTAWGAAAASEQYFGKDVKDLTLAEASLLAGLPAAPTFYSPFGQNPQRSKDKTTVGFEKDG